MAAKKRTANPRSKFTVVDGKEMIEIMEQRDYGDLVKHVIVDIRSGKDLERYPERKQFILDVCAKSEVLEIIMDMILLFLDLYKVFAKGKRYLDLQQSWLEHINDYFDDTQAEGQTELILSVNKERRRL